ncbi:hypothetical protein BOW47_07975 [Solemya velum gill symbiont]|nr:hypothetical protein BOW47_07975 [Solemya velum gill symbiont]
MIVCRLGHRVITLVGELNMSDANRYTAEKQKKKAPKSVQKKTQKSEKTRWFSYMKDDELAPEEIRDIAFLGYN